MKSWLRVLPQDWMWILGELGLGTLICSLPILFAGSFTRESLKVGVLIATATLFISEGIRQFIGVSRVKQFLRDLAGAFEGLVQLRALSTYSELIQMNAEIERLTDVISAVRDKMLWQTQELSAVQDQLSAIRRDSVGSAASREPVSHKEAEAIAQGILKHLLSFQTETVARLDKNEEQLQRGFKVLVEQMRDSLFELRALVASEHVELKGEAADLRTSQGALGSDVRETTSNLELQLTEFRQRHRQDYANLGEAIARLHLRLDHLARASAAPRQISSEHTLPAHSLFLSGSAHEFRDRERAIRLTAESPIDTLTWLSAVLFDPALERIALIDILSRSKSSRRSERFTANMFGGMLESRYALLVGWLLSREAEDLPAEQTKELVRHVWELSRQQFHG